MARPAPFTVRTMNRGAAENLLASTLRKEPSVKSDYSFFNTIMLQKERDQRVGDAMHQKNMDALYSFGGHPMFAEETAAKRKELAQSLIDIHASDPTLRGADTQMRVNDELFKMRDYAKKSLAVGKAHDEYLAAYKNPNITINTKATDMRMNDMMSAGNVDKAYDKLQEFGGSVVVTENYNPYDLISDFDSKKVKEFYNEFPDEYKVDKGGVPWQVHKFDDGRAKEYLLDRILTTSFGKKQFKEWQTTVDNPAQATASNYADFLIKQLKNEYGAEYTERKYRQGTIPRPRSTSSSTKTPKIYFDPDGAGEVTITPGEGEGGAYKLESMYSVGKPGGGDISFSIGSMPAYSTIDGHEYNNIANGRFTLSNIVKSPSVSAQAWNKLSNGDKAVIKDIMDSAAQSGRLWPPTPDSSMAVNISEGLDNGNDVVASPVVQKLLRDRGYGYLLNDGLFGYGKMTGYPTGEDAVTDLVFIPIDKLRPKLKQFGVEFPNTKANQPVKEDTKDDINWAN